MFDLRRFVPSIAISLSTCGLHAANAPLASEIVMLAFSGSATIIVLWEQFESARTHRVRERAVREALSFGHAVGGGGVPPGGSNPAA
jgi:hypothetical protein